MTKKEARGHISRTVTTWDCEFNDGHHEIRDKMPKSSEMKDIRSMAPIQKLYAMSPEVFMANAEEVTE